jgi:hypothetical protein
VRFGFAGKGLWSVLDGLRAGPVGRNGVMAIEPRSTVQVKFFGRCKGGWIRDGVLLAVDQVPRPSAWSCHTDAVIALMEAEPSPMKSDPAHLQRSAAAPASV